jgi:hypothetical protein
MKNRKVYEKHYERLNGSMRMFGGASRVCVGGVPAGGSAVSATSPAIALRDEEDPLEAMGGPERGREVKGGGRD